MVMHIHPSNFFMLLYSEQQDTEKRNIRIYCFNHIYEHLVQMNTYERKNNRKVHISIVYLYKKFASCLDVMIINHMKNRKR